MKNNFCDLYQLIPKEELTRVFRTSTTASAELDPTFLGFEDVYKAVSTFVQKDKIIIDLGCSYAAQAFYFTDFLGYIGVDCGIEDGVHFETANMEFYKMRIQDFCNMVVEKNWNLQNVFAVCSYVPDKEARKIVKKTFPYCLVYYPS